MRLFCENGKHYWEKEGRGRPPKSCPEHREEAQILMHSSVQKAVKQSLPEIEHFENDNPNFDLKLFLEACGL